MVAQLSHDQWYLQQRRGFLVLDRLLVWLGVFLGSIVPGCVDTKLGSGPLGNSVKSDSNDKSISIETSYSGFYCLQFRSPTDTLTWSARMLELFV